MTVGLPSSGSVARRLLGRPRSTVRRHPHRVCSRSPRSRGGPRHCSLARCRSRSRRRLGSLRIRSWAARAGGRAPGTSPCTRTVTSSHASLTIGAGSTIMAEGGFPLRLSCVNAWLRSLETLSRMCRVPLLIPSRSRLWRVLAGHKTNGKPPPLDSPTLCLRVSPGEFYGRLRASCGSRRRRGTGLPSLRRDVEC